MKPTEYMSLVKQNISGIFGDVNIEDVTSQAKPLLNGLIPAIHEQVFIRGVGTYAWGVKAWSTDESLEKSSFSSIDELTNCSGINLETYLFKRGLSNKGIKSANLNNVAIDSGYVQGVSICMPLNEAVPIFLRYTK